MLWLYRIHRGLVALLSLLAATILTAQMPAAAQAPPRMQVVPARQPGEGEGPYPKLVIRGAMVIKGDGSPPIGPMDIVLEGNRIAAVQPAGTPGVPLKTNRSPRDASREIDGTGMW